MVEHLAGQDRTPPARWLAALPSGTNPTAATHAYRQLVQRWNEPHRRYHTIQHLTAVLDLIDQHIHLTDNPQTVRLAAWFHDAVYDPRAGDNEERSAQLALRTLGSLGSPDALASDVARLVRLTATHNPADNDRDGALLVDADLAILAADPGTYDGYALGVREEYRHVPDELFRAGRAAVLTRLADVPMAYRILPDRSAMRVRAEHNLRRELASLAVTPNRAG